MDLDPGPRYWTWSVDLRIRQRALLRLTSRRLTELSTEHKHQIRPLVHVVNVWALIESVWFSSLFTRPDGVQESAKIGISSGHRSSPSDVEEPPSIGQDLDEGKFSILSHGAVTQWRLYLVHIFELLLIALDTMTEPRAENTF